MKEYRALAGPAVAIVLFGAFMLWSPFQPDLEPEGEPAPFDREAQWDDADWDVFASKVRWATDARLDTLPIGEAMAVLGESFVGTDYVPGTLEVAGPEALVINFRGLDCVTFVENVFAMTRFVRGGGAGRLEDRARAEAAYEAILREHRYRNGQIVGYPSRLHYFSEWIADNGRRSLVEDLGVALGGEVDTSPIDFMSTHPDAYRQLAEPAFLDAVRQIETVLSDRGRTYVPQERIAEVAGRIRNGDIIAATSTVDGLDIAHTGLALWRDDTPHLLHAPLVGSSVEVSEVSLAERIRRIEGQDGIMVARPTGS